MKTTLFVLKTFTREVKEANEKERVDRGHDNVNRVN